MFRRESMPRKFSEREGPNPLPAETALHWSAEDQQSVEDEAGGLQEGDEPDPKQTI